MKPPTLFLMLFVVFGCQGPEYELIIRNGMVYDGSGGAPTYTDVGVKADTIAIIGKLSDEKGRHEVNAEGLAVAPGFINMLSWANVALLEDGRSQSDLRQGVTLEVMGEGSSMGPMTEEMKADAVEDQGDIKYEIKWSTLGEYLRYLEEKGVSTNVASFVGNGTLREYVIGMEKRKARPEEIKKMQELLEMEMRAGAMGISSSLLYAPSSSADTEELVALAKVAAQHNGMYISHIRSEDDFLLEGIGELIEISKRAQVPAEIYHLKASGENNWHKMDSAIQLIQSARDQGLAITADMYTYPASSTGLHTQMPEWTREDGVDAMLERLENPVLQAKILPEIEFQHAPDNILLVGFKNENLRKYIGRRLSEVAAERGKSPEQTMMDLMLEDRSRIQVVFFAMSEENLEKIIKLPWVSFCSDGGSYTNEGVFIKQSTHPRAYGSFIRVLGKYSRDMGLITLEEAVRRLSALPAENLKLKKRGKLEPGFFADIVVFDPEKVRDKATFEEPHQYAEGMVHVFVNGTQVIKEGEHTGATPGRFVKGPGYTGLN
jgi:N-acyl-D-amino-acid deacylase